MSKNRERTEHGRRGRVKRKGIISQIGAGSARCHLQSSILDAIICRHLHASIDQQNKWNTMKNYRDVNADKK